MEDILALVVVLVVIGSAWAIGRIVYVSHKKAKQREYERMQLLLKKKEEWRNPTPSTYAEAMSAPVQRSKPAMKKANVKSDYVSTPMTSTSSTSTAGSLDIGDVITGALVLNELFGHKTGGSDPIDFPKEERSAGVSSKESSWGFDDSDSRSSISSSMDTSSSYSSSDFGSSDSGPSSDW